MIVWSWQNSPLSHEDTLGITCSSHHYRLLLGVEVPELFISLGQRAHYQYPPTPDVFIFATKQPCSPAGRCCRGFEAARLTQFLIMNNKKDSQWKKTISHTRRKWLTRIGRGCQRHQVKRTFLGRSIISRLKKDNFMARSKLSLMDEHLCHCCGNSHGDTSICALINKMGLNSQMQIGCCSRCVNRESAIMQAEGIRAN